MILDLLQKRYTAKWWENQPVCHADLDTVLRSAFLAPSKQSRYDYKIFVFTDSVQGQRLKQWFYWENTACLDTVRGKIGPGLRRYNGQVLAPIYLMWIAATDDMEIRDDCLVSATVAMMAAEELGLQTGLCGCIGPTEIQQKFDISGHAVVSLGLGYAVCDVIEKRKVFRDGKEMGFDLANCDADLSTFHVRNNKPSYDQLISIF